MVTSYYGQARGSVTVNFRLAHKLRAHGVPSLILKIYHRFRNAASRAGEFIRQKLFRLFRKPPKSKLLRVEPDQIDGAQKDLRDFNVCDLRNVAAQKAWRICNLSLPSAYACHPEIATAVRAAGGSARAFPPAPFIVHARDVGVVGGGRYLALEDDVMIHDEMHTFLHDDTVSLKYFRGTLPERIDHQRIRMEIPRKTESTIRAGVHAMHEHATNYFHLVTEVLPRVLIAREEGISSDFPLLINAGLHRNLRELLDIIEPHRKKVPLMTGRVYSVNHLVFPSDVSSVQDVYVRPRWSWESVLHRELIRSCVETVLVAKQADKAPSRHRWVYVRRGSRYRALTNEQAIETMLAEMNFETITPEDLTLDAQVSIFRDAEIVVAPTGAALTNIVWCKPETTVIVLASDHEAVPLEVWKQLAEVSGCQVLFVRGTQGPTHHPGLPRMHCDYTISPSAVAAVLSAVLKSVLPHTPSHC